VPARLTHGEPAREARSLSPSEPAPAREARADGGDRTRDPQLGKPVEDASRCELARTNRTVTRNAPARREPPRVGARRVRWHGRWHGAPARGSATRSLTISSVNDSGGAPWPEPDSSTTSGLACRISSRPSSTTTSSCPCSGSANGSTQAPEDHSTTGLTVLKVRSCSSTKQRNREPTHEAKQVFITSHSWSRAERSSEKRTNGHVRARPSSWTNQASSLSMGNTVLRPTGSILTDLSSRRFATVPRRASRDRPQARREREGRAEISSASGTKSPIRSGRPEIRKRRSHGSRRRRRRGMASASTSKA
jgi:hypothetical protein